MGHTFVGVHGGQKTLDSLELELAGRCESWDKGAGNQTHIFHKNSKDPNIRASLQLLTICWLNLLNHFAVHTIMQKGFCLQVLIISLAFGHPNR